MVYERLIATPYWPSYGIHENKKEKKMDKSCMSFENMISKFYKF